MMHPPGARAVRHLLSLAVVALATTAGAAPLPLLRITDLSAASGLAGSRALDINNRGVVMAYHHPDRTYLWQAGTEPQVFQAPPGYTLHAHALNDNSVAVGQLVYENSGLSSAVTWTATDGLKRIELRRHQYNGNAIAINNRHQIVGSATVKVDAQWHTHAMVGSLRLGLDDPLHTRDGASEARAINNVGHAGGSASSAQGCCRNAVLMDRQGRFTLLGTLAKPGDPDYSTVFALNDTDEAVGSSDIDGAGHAFYWSAATGMLPLQVGPGLDDWSHAVDINQHGQVVGNFGRGTQTSSFYWDAENGAVDLQALLDPADPLTPRTRIGDLGARINDHGDIVVNAQIDGDYTAVLLRPVPR